MKKIKHISAVVFVLVQMLVASFLPISAGVRFDTEPCHIYMDGANLNGGNFFIKTYNGLPVYCIEPWVTISWEDVYDVGTLEDYEKLSAQAKEHIAEFSYFGYGYSGHQSGEYYVATQYLIWLELDPEFVRDSHFYTENKGECIDAEMNVYIHDILREVDQYRAPAAFTVTSSSQSEQVGNYYAGKGTMGEGREGGGKSSKPSGAASFVFDSVSDFVYVFVFDSVSDFVYVFVFDSVSVYPKLYFRACKVKIHAVAACTPQFPLNAAKLLNAAAFFLFWCFHRKANCLIFNSSTDAAA